MEGREGSAQVRGTAGGTGEAAGGFVLIFTSHLPWFYSRLPTSEKELGTYQCDSKLINYFFSSSSVLIRKD